MRITNTSAIPDAVVRAVVRFAANHREVTQYVRRVDVYPSKHLWKAWSRGRTQAMYVGDAKHFPYTRHSKYDRGPAPFEVRDPVEALAMLAGHEMQHSRQFMVRSQQFMSSAPGPRARLSEVDAEQFGYAVMMAFREQRDAIIGPALAKQEVVDAYKQRAAADRAARAPHEAIAKLEAKVKAWRSRERRAATWRKKWERRLARARKAVTP